MLRVFALIGALSLAPAIGHAAMAPASDDPPPPNYAQDQQPSFAVQTRLTPDGAASLGFQSPAADSQLDQRGLNEATETMGQAPDSILGGQIRLPFG
ncbi:MAG TPA: hypothetical protein VGS12_10080 [Caulobacteraceae bacterium]|nr:hypothetical protein [Caulobacteraceae bacterium]